MGDTLDEAVYCSWNNQKKEYQDEIRKLTNEVSKYRESWTGSSQSFSLETRMPGDVTQLISKNTIDMTIVMLTSYPGFARV